MNIIIIIIVLVSIIVLFIFTLVEDFKEDIAKKDSRLSVSCENCKCLLLKISAHQIMSPYTDNFYCQKCKPNYNKVLNDYSGKMHYYKELEVTKDGEPVGYKKK